MPRRRPAVQAATARAAAAAPPLLLLLLQLLFVAAQAKAGPAVISLAVDGRASSGMATCYCGSGTDGVGGNAAQRPGCCSGGTGASSEVAAAAGLLRGTAARGSQQGGPAVTPQAPAQQILLSPIRGGLQHGRRALAAAPGPSPSPSGTTPPVRPTTKTSTVRTTASRVNRTAPHSVATANRTAAAPGNRTTAAASGNRTAAAALGNRTAPMAPNVTLNETLLRACLKPGSGRNATPAECRHLSAAHLGSIGYLMANEEMRECDENCEVVCAQLPSLAASGGLNCGGVDFGRRRHRQLAAAAAAGGEGEVPRRALRGRGHGHGRGHGNGGG